MNAFGLPALRWYCWEFKHVNPQPPHPPSKKKEILFYVNLTICFFCDLKSSRGIHRKPKNREYNMQTTQNTPSWDLNQDLLALREFSFLFLRTSWPSLNSPMTIPKMLQVNKQMCCLDILFLRWPHITSTLSSNNREKVQQMLSLILPVVFARTFLLELIRMYIYYSKNKTCLWIFLKHICALLSCTDSSSSSHVSTRDTSTVGLEFICDSVRTSPDRISIVNIFSPSFHFVIFYNYTVWSYNYLLCTKRLWVDVCMLAAFCRSAPTYAFIYLFLGFLNHLTS